jgi:hypothetical protein
MRIAMKTSAMASKCVDRAASPGRRTPPVDRPAPTATLRLPAQLYQELRRQASGPVDKEHP